MTDTAIAQPAAPKPRKAKKPRAAKPKPVVENEFAGMTMTTCAAACTKKRCIISTVDVCKHPLLAPANGCGPVTLKNRDRAAKYLKHRKIEAS